MIDVKVDSHQRARDVYESMLRSIKDGKLTGTFVTVVTANQGGVRSAETYRAADDRKVICLESLE